MPAKSELRLKWIKLYQQLGHLGKVCQHFGISRITLSKWIKRYQEQGREGLIDHSSKPKRSPFQKRNDDNENLILTLRKNVT
jgi:transposase-like protein